MGSQRDIPDIPDIAPISNPHGLDWLIQVPGGVQGF